MSQKRFDPADYISFSPKVQEIIWVYGADDLTIKLGILSPEGNQCLAELYSAFADSLRVDGVRISEGRFVSIGNVAIDFITWKYRYGKSVIQWELIGSRKDLIAEFNGAKKIQAQIEKIVAMLLPKPIAEAIIEEFSGWFHYNIILND